MENIVNNIQAEATIVHKYFEDPQSVIDHINTMEKDLINELIDIYKDKCIGKSGKKKGKLKMVNAVRLEVLYRLSKNESVSIDLINNLMESIRQNNPNPFKNCDKEIKSAIEEFEEKSKDSFSNWRKPARMFHPLYFYPAKQKEIGENLESLADNLINELNLKEYTFHYIDFQGATQFGSETCWLAIYPSESGGHKNAYQLFISIYKGGFTSGIYTGSNVKVDREDSEDFTDFDTALNNLKKHVNSVLEFNQNIILKDKNKKKIEQDEVSITEQEGDILDDYNYDLALESMFLGNEKLDSIINALKIKKNVILQGPPGVGKTFIAQKIAWLFNEKIDRTLVDMVQFHQSYSYEDFIQGIRPNSDGTFEVRNGPFYKFCKKAEKSPNQKYFFIIDEINRGNLSKVFGELMMLLEADKRDKSYSLKLTYSEDDETFHIPENVYVIGTMNTADRSLSMVDFALRRRFAFINLKPEYESKKFHSHLIENGVPETVSKLIVNKMTNLNEKIVNQYKQLGEGFAIGHSFFSSLPENITYDMKWYRSVINTEIAPLLHEYWFDDEEKAKSEINDLLRVS